MRRPLSPAASPYRIGTGGAKPQPPHWSLHDSGYLNWKMRADAATCAVSLRTPLMGGAYLDSTQRSHRPEGADWRSAVTGHSVGVPSLRVLGGATSYGLAPALLINRGSARYVP